MTTWGDYMHSLGRTDMNNSDFWMIPTRVTSKGPKAGKKFIVSLTENNLSYLNLAPPSGLHIRPN